MNTQDYEGKIVANIKVDYKLEEMIITFTDDTKIIIQCKQLKVYEEGVMI